MSGSPCLDSYYCQTREAPTPARGPSAHAVCPIKRGEPPNEPPKANPPGKPNAASNATSPARSTGSSNTPKSTLDKHRSIVSANGPKTDVELRDEVGLRRPTRDHRRSTRSSVATVPGSMSTIADGCAICASQTVSFQNILLFPLLMHYSQYRSSIFNTDKAFLHPSPRCR